MMVVTKTLKGLPQLWEELRRKLLLGMGFTFDDTDRKGVATPSSRCIG